MLELACVGTVGGEDGTAVAVLAAVGEGNRILEGVHRETHQHGAEDLLRVGAVVGVHAVEHAGADEVALLVVGHLHAAAVQQQLGAVLDTLLDQLLHTGLGLLADQRTNLI